MATLDPAAEPGGSPVDISERIADLLELHDIAIKWMDNAHLSPNDPVKRRIVCLFLRIVELSGACITLHHANVFTGIPILARSSVEALADLLALEKDPAHIDSMTLRDLNQQKRLWTDKDALQSECIKKGLEHPTAKEDVNWIKNTADSLEGATWSVKGVFEDADLKEIYAIHYNRLCVEAHNNGQSLYERHIGRNAKTGQRGPVYLKYPTHATSLGLGVAATSLEAAIATTAKMFDKLALLPTGRHP